MKQTLKAVRGMNDILPSDSCNWQEVEQTIISAIKAYGYQEIRFPLVEQTALFKRSIGEVTDIVEKEMYTFDDRNGDSLSLRPEGTACCVRAALEHGLLHNQTQRLWYLGPMFRHERPQKGRYRQFYQFGVEAFGFDDVDIELEMLLMNARFWQHLGLSEHIHLEINSLGTSEERRVYREHLVEYFQSHIDDLDDDSKRRLHSNPLRILDSKNPSMQALIEQAPKLQDYFQTDSLSRFERLQEGLNALDIAFRINTRLVRGLDYYSHTVFEWVTQDLGAQGTVCAGGRYDGLIEQLGGKPNTAVGFAMGVERLVLLYKNIKTARQTSACDVYIIKDPAVSNAHVQSIAEQVRNANTSLRVISHSGGGSFKSQFKKADKSGAQLAFILGENELKRGAVGFKVLRHQALRQDDNQQGVIALDEFVGWIKRRDWRHE